MLYKNTDGLSRKSDLGLVESGGSWSLLALSSYSAVTQITDTHTIRYGSSCADLSQLYGVNHLCSGIFRLQPLLLSNLCRPSEILSDLFQSETSVRGQRYLVVRSTSGSAHPRHPAATSGEHYEERRMTGILLATMLLP